MSETENERAGSMSFSFGIRQQDTDGDRLRPESSDEYIMSSWFHTVVISVQLPKLLGAVRPCEFFLSVATSSLQGGVRYSHREVVFRSIRSVTTSATFRAKFQLPRLRVKVTVRC